LPDAGAVAAAVAVLDALREVDPGDPRVVAVERAAAHLHKAAKQNRRRARKQERGRVDRALATGSARAAAYFGAQVAPPERARVLRRQRTCYVCKQPFRQLHAFYHALCPGCAARNFAARGDTADLIGRRAIVIGGRVKIGFEVGAALARAGAGVTITTRFPRDAERRYAEAGLGDRVEIVGLDFCDLRGVLGWIDGELARARPLDILINNAAQTVRRPPAYYARLVDSERAALPPGVVSALPPPLGDLAEQVREARVFPAGVDEEGEPLDLRPRNSWVLGASEVDPVELVEVHVINAIAPFLLASRLRPLLAASAFADRYIVNVSAMEGVFAYPNKQPRHPHTNMAKAALNMFTRTSAEDYVRDGIHMNSVDTGWVTQENPQPHKQRAEAAGFCPPLDIVDGAARVLAPIFRGVRGAPVAGVLFKDYEPAAW
jgi:NAD(P)-dependent dehydrogenase (short-subunit alcohol dehydrogenase family)